MHRHINRSLLRHVGWLASRVADNSMKKFVCLSFALLIAAGCNNRNAAPVERLNKEAVASPAPPSTIDNLGQETTPPTAPVDGRYEVRGRDSMMPALLLFTL